MKLAVISDIHGNIAALEATLADIGRRGISEIVNLGDCLSGPFDAVATAERLMSLQLPTVRGNHDRALYDRPRDEMGTWEQWVIDDLNSAHIDWLQSFPMTLRIGGALLCHATPEKDDQNWLEYRGKERRLIARDLKDIAVHSADADAELILCGHTHVPRVVRLPDGPTIANPGSVGCPAYLDTRTSPHFIHQMGSPDARYAIVEAQEDSFQVDLISVPYDASEMAELARKKGAESWAQAVTTGWFA